MGVCVATILVSGGVFARAQEQPADTILFNGKIFTSDSSLPYAQAVAIRGERIVAVGDSETVKKLAGAQTKQIDLGGGARRFRESTTRTITWICIPRMKWTSRRNR